jgi:hypothetical protein
MSKRDRQRIIGQIEASRGSRVITYVTSTRPGLESAMAMDVPRKLFEHLRAGPRKKTNKVDLFLHSNGGDGTVPWRLVSLIREFAKRFAVLVPYKAFSAATLTALGADEIIMHPMGMLGPTDANVNTPFNPPVPGGSPGQTLGINVEDVTAFISLLREDAGINHEEELVQAFNKLAGRVHPLALGAVKRSLSQQRMMAKKLLELHMDQTGDQHDIDQIVENLTSKLFYHGHPINRHEAKAAIGLTKVVDAPRTLERLMWNLYELYEQEMKLEEPFDVAMEFLSQYPSPPQAASAAPPMAAVPPAQLPPPAQPAQPAPTAQIPPHLQQFFPNPPAPPTPQITDRKSANLAYVESGRRTDVFIMDYQLSGLWQPNGAVGVTLLIQGKGWRRE